MRARSRGTLALVASLLAHVGLLGWWAGSAPARRLPAAAPGAEAEARVIDARIIRVPAVLSSAPSAPSNGAAGKAFETVPSSRGPAQRTAPPLGRAMPPGAPRDVAIREHAATAPPTDVAPPSGVEQAGGAAEPPAWGMDTVARALQAERAWQHRQRAGVEGRQPNTADGMAREAGLSTGGAVGGSGAVTAHEGWSNGARVAEVRMGRWRYCLRGLRPDQDRSLGAMPPQVLATNCSANP